MLRFQLLPTGWRYAAKAAIAIGTLILLLWVIALAALRFIVVPNIEGFRPRLIEFMQSSLGSKVEIGALAADWDGWNPRFTVHELTLIDKAGNVALKLPRVEKVMSWRSLLSLQVTAHALTIDGLNIAVRRDKNNRISVAGLEIAEQQPKTEPDARVADWLLAQRNVMLRNAQIVWHDDFRGAPAVALKDVNVRLLNQGNRHRLGLTAAWSDTVASPIQLIADINGTSAAKLDTWNGQIYLRMDAADIARAKLWVTLPFPVQSGVGGVQAWVRLDKGRPEDITADLRLTQVRAKLDGAREPLNLAKLSGRVQWSEASGKSTLTNVKAENLSVVFPDKEAIGPLSFKGLLRRNAQGGFERSEIALDGFDIGASTRLLKEFPLPPALADALVALAPRGGLGRTTVDWDGEPSAPKNYALNTTFTDLSFTRWEKLPGLSGVSGNLKLTHEGGQLEIANTARGTAVDYPSVFAVQPKFEKLSGKANWTTSARGLDVSLSDVVLQNVDLGLKFSGKWSRDAKESGPGVADFVGVIERGEASRIWAYLPTVIESNVREYVKHAFVLGKISRGDFVLKGPLAKFPFPNDDGGQWRIAAVADDVTFDYADNWPKAEDADITLTISGSRLVADIANAKIKGVPLKNVRTSINDFRLATPQLSVIGSATGRTQQFLQFVDESPIGDWIAHFTRDMKAEGEGALNLAFELPLGDPKAKAAVRGDFEFQGNALNLGPDIPPISDVRGKLVFTERTTSSKDLQVRVLGGPAALSLQNVTGGLKINATGQADLATVRAYYNIAQLDRMSGQTDWSMELDTPSGGGFVVKSSLRGATINAPAPLGKVAGEARALTVTREVLPNKKDNISVEMGDDLKWKMRLAQKDGKRVVEAGALGVGQAVPDLPAAQKVQIAIAQPEVNVDKWLELATLLNTPATNSESIAKTAPQVSATVAATGAISAQVAEQQSALAPSEILIRAERVIASGARLTKVDLRARPVGANWVIDLKSAEADGQVTWQPEANKGAGMVRARLAKLIVAPKEAPGAVATGEAAPENTKGRANWPAIDVVAEAFTLRGNAMGKLEIVAWPNGENWKIEQLNVVSADANLHAEGEWKRTLAQPETALTAKLDIIDTPKYFARLGMGENIRDGKGKLDGQIKWIGSPIDFSMAALDGDVNFELGQGRFLKADPGIAKLLGVFSLQSLARRLVFDMRDLFSDGFSFDRVQGAWKLKRGILTTDNLNIAGPTARVEIRGTINLPNETQDLNVRVLPDVSTSLAVGAGVVTANPLIGAGAFIASKILKDPLDRAFSVKLKVEGTWSDPKVDWLDKPGPQRAANEQNGQ
jgi:uncharacterized protein (TIGR02099 family)